MSMYLKNWRVNLIARTISPVIHLNKRQASRKLNAMVYNNALQFTASFYLGVKLDRTITVHQHIDKDTAGVSWTPIYH